MKNETASTKQGHLSSVDNTMQISHTSEKRKRVQSASKSKDGENDCELNCQGDAAVTTSKKSKKNCASNVHKMCDVTKPESFSHVATQTLVRGGTKTADPGPSNRWGHSMCMINDSEAVLIGGQGDKHILCKDALWRLDMTNGSWSVPETQTGTSKPEARMGHSTVFDANLRSVYVFGGSKNKKWFSDIQTIDVNTWQWQCIRANGSAPSRSYHTATLYGHEIWVFGGVFPRPDPEPDSCSNEIHVFNLLEEVWYTPLVMGTKPPARSGHSATLFENRLVVFGGWDAPVCYNDLYILDLSLVEWSKPDVKGTPPSPRSWHSSCALSGTRLFVHGGYNGNLALGDSFIFDLDTMAWSSVSVEPTVLARTGHVALCLPYRHDDEDPHDEVLLFGGGDNEGKFFNELISVSIPKRPSSS